MVLLRFTAEARGKVTLFKTLVITSKTDKSRAMKFSKKDLIFVIILPIIFGIAAIAIGTYHLIHLSKVKNEVEKVGKVFEEYEKRGKAAEFVLSKPVSKEQIRRQIESLRAVLSQEKLEKAIILAEWGTERLKVKKSEEAIKNLEEALEVLPEGCEASLSTHFNLGIALIEFLGGDREANLKKAIESCNKVIFVLQQNKPKLYASAQNNMGVAYCGLWAIGDRKADLSKAIRAYEEALRVFTFDRFPQENAMTINNLADAYWSLAKVTDSSKTNPRR